MPYRLYGTEEWTPSCFEHIGIVHTGVNSVRNLHILSSGGTGWQYLARSVGNRLILAKDMVLFCASQITDFKYSTPVCFVLFCFVLQIGSKAVLITGCDSGFGFALAKHLHDKGFIIYAGCLQKVGKTRTVFFTCGTCTDT